MKYSELENRFILHEPISERVAIYPPEKIVTEYIILTPDGVLLIDKGFIFGPSGPTHADQYNMRASAVHDAGYWLMSMGRLSQKWRIAWDKELRRIMIEVTRGCGWVKRTLGWFRAQYYYIAVRWQGRSAASRRKQEILEAP